MNNKTSKKVPYSRGSRQYIYSTSNNVSKKEIYIRDKALINWALQNKDEDNILSVYILSNIILRISNTDEIKERYGKKCDISSINTSYNMAIGTIGSILVYFLSAFRYELIKLGRTEVKESKDIFSLPLETKGILRIFSKDDDRLQPYYFYIKNDVILLFYNDLIKTFLEITKTCYKQDFTEYLERDFFDEDDDEDEDEDDEDEDEDDEDEDEDDEENGVYLFDDYARIFTLGIQTEIIYITEDLAELMVHTVIKRLGVPDFEEHRKRLFKFEHPRLYFLKNEGPQIFFVIFIFLLLLSISIYFDNSI